MCEAAPPVVRLSVTSEGGPFTRGDAVSIAFETDRPAEVAFTSTPGGRFVERADHVFWSAGGEDAEGDVDWPWFTGPVTVTATARDADGCVGEASVDIVLAGDVVLTDALRGTLLVYGSDGRYLGRYAQVIEGRGLGAIITMPRSAGGGVLVAVGPEGGRRAEMKHLGPGGELVRDFESTDLAGIPLWAEGEGPRALLYWPARDEILADNGDEGRIFRFNPAGEYLGDYVLPGDGAFGRESIGFGLVGERAVAGVGQRERIYYIDSPDPPEAAELMVEAGDGFDSLIAVGSGYDDTVVALMRRGGNEFRAYAYDTRARQTAMTFLRFETRYITRFLGAYLTLDLNGFALRGLDLQTIEEDWDEIADINIGTRGGFAWLDPP